MTQFMLNPRLTAYLNYFERLALQPPNRWDGFYLAGRDDRTFALRFQLAFPCYALGAICLHAQAGPAEQNRCRTAMAALIDRMLQRRVWAYWVRLRESQGDSLDPVAEANLQYSGHLAMMIGVFEAVGGDSRYDEPFTLLWTGDVRFTYTHTTLVEAIWRQMRASKASCVDDLPGRAHPASMGHALWATVLHDQVHGTDYAEANAGWLRFLERQLTLHGPRMPGRGALSAIYNTRWRIPAPIGYNAADAWALAFLTALEPERGRRLAARFLSRIRRLHAEAGEQAYTPCGEFWRSRELADLSLATGFSFVLAMALDDEALAAALSRYADQHLRPAGHDGERCYEGGLAAPFTTALFALGEAGGLRAIRAATQRLSVSLEGSARYPQ